MLNKEEIYKRSKVKEFNKKLLELLKSQLKLGLSSPCPYLGSEDFYMEDEGTFYWPQPESF